MAADDARRPPSDPPTDPADDTTPTIGVERPAAPPRPPLTGGNESPTVDAAEHPTVDAAEMPTVGAGGPRPPGVHEPRRPEPASFGPYHLLERIGEGGMGEVWLAEQSEPVRRKVALKVIKRGMDSKRVVARFESERQALALMQHPCIARVFDGGETPGGRPYFVMEYVRGKPITEHCDQQRLGTRARIELFMQVCDGVQHAHHKAIIHRDLKPTNILVALDGERAEPKIIDFGIAKATAGSSEEDAGLTELGQMIGTPEYMSPEQAEISEQNVDTRTDVYALGIVLYELLVGALPFEAGELRRAGFDGLRRQIREVEPPRPSTRLSRLGETSTALAHNRQTDPRALASVLRGDLDWIVMKALEKDRDRRYSSPSELAADLGRYLRNEPIVARPPSAAYKTSKFVRRHRLAVAFAGSMLVLLISFAITMTLQAGRIARERDRANSEATAASEVSDFLVGLFEVSDPYAAQGNSITARQILDRGAERIRQELNDQPRVQARLMDTMGEVYMRLGLYDESRPLLEEARQALARSVGADHPDAARNLENLGVLLAQTGEFDAARPLYERSLALREAAFGPEHVEVASVVGNLGSLALRTGKLEEARGHYERALRIREAVLGPDHPEVARSLTNLAILARREGNDAAARPAFERAVQVFEKAYGPDHSDTAQAIHNLAVLLGTMGESTTARGLYERSLAIRERVLGPDHPDVATSLNNLGNILGASHDYAGARRLHERALAIRRSRLGPAHRETAQSLNNIAITLKSEGRLAEARPLVEQAIATWEAALGPKHASVALGYYNLASLVALQGDRKGALALLRQSLDRGFASKAIFDDPDVASLRGEPEFEEVVAEVRARLAKKD